MTGSIYAKSEPLFGEVEAFFSQRENPYLFDLCSRAGIEQFSEVLHERIALVKTRNDLLAVAVVGTFKAGKSTLINAIIGKTVAYVDTFEATTTTAYIYPGAQEGAYIESDGKRQLISIDAYLRECEKKRLSNVSKVDITTDHSLPLLLIDTPGMGTVTQKHEDRADNAVLAADLVLWVMDPNELLTALDAAFLKRAQEIGLPVWCILSKVDEFNDDEINDCVGCLVERLGIIQEDIFSVSAQEHLNSGKNTGVLRLIGHLSQAVKSAPLTKQKAVHAQTIELLNEVQSCLMSIADECDGDVQLITCQATVLKENAESINSKIATRLQEKMVSSMVSFIEREISDNLRSAASVDSIVEQAFDKYMSIRYPNDVKEASRDLESSVKSLWDQDFNARANDLQRQIDMMTRQSSYDSSTLDYLRSQLRTTKELKAAFDEGYNVWPYAVAVAALSLLFPHGLLIAGGLVAGATGYDQLSKLFRSSKKEEAMTGLRAELTQLSTGFVDQFIKDAVYPALDDLLDKAINRYCQMQFNGTDQQGLKAMMDHVTKMRDQAVSLLGECKTGNIEIHDEIEWVGMTE